MSRIVILAQLPIPRPSDVLATRAVVLLLPAKPWPKKIAGVPCYLTSDPDDQGPIIPILLQYSSFPGSTLSCRVRGLTVLDTRA
jgi:hypothetical protein